MRVDLKADFRRRDFLTGAGALIVSILCVESVAQEVAKEISDLKPGEFTWHPERQPSGPVAVVVSLPEQRVHVYRNGVRIAVSTCSTGKEGHRTPTGVFVVLEKDAHHHSSTYNNAPMPNMNRLTWSGIALHAGNLPGYPASHGCVRLPSDFSAKLFTVTHLGTPVLIAGAHSDPWELTHPGMILGSYAESEFRGIEASLAGKKQPSDWAESEKAPIVSVVASAADQKIMLIENGDVIAESNLTVAGKTPLGSHVFILQGSNDGSNGLKWVALSHTAEPNVASQPEESVLQRLQADDRFVTAVRDRMHPGMTTILTNAPLHPDTRSGKDFVIMS
jgi:hypothetical protein